MTDALDDARALIARGDIDGAERTLAIAALGGHDAAARALVNLCERRGDMSLRAQEALDAFVQRRSPGDDNKAARARVRALFSTLGVTEVTAPQNAVLPDLPDLDGFESKAAVDEPTHRQPFSQSLADVADELSLAPLEPVPIDLVPAPPTGTPAPTPAPVSGDVHRLCTPGTLIHDRYEVRSELGRGGYATVLRVFDRELSEECALKIFHNSGNADDVARFKREASVSRRIVHENVVKLYDIGQEHGFYYLTMELLDGEDLAHVLKSRSITLGDALRWLIDACRGLQAAHDKGVVHRDVKPGNLFVLKSGAVKITDFGIAKPADMLSLTTTGVFVGTPQYVSPEQIRGLDVTPAADVYSLGVVAYLCLTGTLPFRDKEMVALLMKHVSAVPEPPRTRNPALPAALDALIVSCLAKEPEQRPASCAAVADAFAKVLRTRR